MATQSLDKVIQEADMLQTRLKQGHLNLNELDSFFVRVRKLSAPKGKAGRVVVQKRIADAMQKLDRPKNLKQQ